MPTSLLTLLKFCFLALLYLFMVRVVRAVWVEVKGPPRTLPAGSVPRTRRERLTVRNPDGKAPRGVKPVKVKGLPHLRVVEPAELAGRSFALSDELTVGRAAGCQITLDDTYVSQLHARLFRREGEFYVEDLGSTNGTYLNRRKVTGPMVFRRGDRIQVGKTIMELSR